MEKQPYSGIEINVVETDAGRPEIAIFLHDLDRMILVTPKGARDMAFWLMECADHVAPPFSEASEHSDSESVFGPYEPDALEEIEEDLDSDIDEEQ